MRMKGETVHQVRYTDGLCVLSLFQTPRPTKKPTEAESGRNGMLELVTWKQQGRHYTLMGDVSRDMLQDISQSFRAAH
jgi:negative regulator of sigma E activity